MKTQTKQFDRYKYTALAFLMPMAGLLFLRILSTLTFDGVYSMLYSDCYHQYYPFFVAFREALRSGESLLFSWNVGMGVDYLGMLAYYLGSPLNLLSALLPEKWLLGYFSFLMPLKLSLASSFFALLLKNLFHKDDFSLPIFGCFYAFCAWALGYQWNIMWLDSFALLPLLILGMVRLLTERRFILYTVSLFLTFGINYYIGYFCCIFVFLTFLCYQVCNWQSLRRFAIDLVYMAVFTVLGLGMSTFLSLPAIFGLKSTESGTNDFPKEFAMNMVTGKTWKDFLQAMGKVAGNMNGGIEPTFKEGLPNVFCGIAVNMLAILFFTVKNIKVREKVCCLLLLLLFTASFIIRQLDYIWHGFHFTNMIPYRFSFLFSFVLLYMAYQAWLHRHEFRLWQIALGCVLCLGLVLCNDEILAFQDLLTGKAMLLSGHSVENLLTNLQTISAACSYPLFNLLFIGSYTGVLCFGRKLPQPITDSQHRLEKWEERTQTRQNISTLVMLSVMGIELVMILTNFGIWYPGTNLSHYPRKGADTQAVIAHMEQREEASDFYRVEVTQSQTLNDGALNGYNGISIFSSSANKSVTNFMRALGFSAQDTHNRYTYEESSPVANLFLNLKYLIERDGPANNSEYFQQVYTSNEVQLLENTAYLPLGFLANSQIISTDFSSNMNRFQFQNILMENATGINKNCWTLIPGYALTIVGEDVTLKPQSQTGYCSYSTEATPGTITYRYTPQQEGLFCFYVEQTQRNSITVYVNGDQTTLHAEAYSLPQMMSVCNVTPGDTVEILLRCGSNQSGVIQLSAAVLDTEAFRQGYEVLASSTLDLTEFSTTYIEGTIHCDRNGILYTSIPQNGNWYATVDGKPAQIVLIGDVMVGLNLSEGTHTVSFRYKNAAFSIGWKISLLCTLVFAFCVYVHLRPRLRRKKGKFEK